MATRHSINSLLDEDSSEMVALSSGEMAKQRTDKKRKHRGLSINPVPSVVEYDLPDVCSAYLHDLWVCVINLCVSAFCCGNHGGLTMETVFDSAPKSFTTNL